MSAIIYFLVIGLVIGLLARLLLPGRQKIGIALTILLGILGAVIGGVVAQLLGTGRIGDMDLLGGIVAVLASVGLLAAAQAAGIGVSRDHDAVGPDRGGRIGR